MSTDKIMHPHRFASASHSSGILLLVFAFSMPLQGCSSLRARLARTPAAEPGESMPLSSADQAMQAEACRRTAMELASHDQDEHAISQFKHARELDPRIRGVAHPLAVLYDRQGRVDAAEREYLLALKETPRSPEVLNDYGYYQYSQGNFTAAESMLRLALKHDPVSEKANTNLGMTLAAQQRFDEAFQSFEKAVGPAAAHHNIGLLMLRVGREPEGLSHLEQAAHRDPSLKQTRAILASLEGAAPGTVELTQFEQLDGEPLN